MRWKILCIQNIKKNKNIFKEKMKCQVSFKEYRVVCCDAKKRPEKVKVLVRHLKKEVLWLLVRECTPRCLKMETTSTAAPPMCKGGGEFLLLLKSKIISFVFLTLMQRLLSLQWLSSLSTSACSHTHHCWWCIPPQLCHLQTSQYDSFDVLLSSHMSAGWTGGDLAQPPGELQCWRWWGRRSWS